MTARQGNIDAAVHDADPINAGLLAAAWSESTARRDLLAGIVDHAPVTEIPRRSRRTVLIAALVTVLTAAALLLAGWSARQASITAPANSERTEVFTRGLPDFGVNCALPGGKEVFAYGSTGGWPNPGEDLTPEDPARTCEEEWRYQGLEPPDMAAYWNGSGEITAVPADRDVPASWRPYTYEPVPPAVLELQTSLVDYVDGLQSDCFDADGGRALAEQELRRLGLDDWQVTVRDVPAESASRGCAGALPHFDDKEIEIVPGLDAAAGEHAVERWADRVHRTLEGRCYTVNQAASKVRSLFAEKEFDMGLIPLSGLDGTNIDAYEWSIGKHVDADAECTRVDINYWGPFLEVVLRGPKA